MNYTEDGDSLLIYVPLSSIEEELGETPLAFGGQMVYQAGENGGAVHQVRLGWMVNALQDTCDTTTMPDTFTSQEGKSVSKEDSVRLPRAFHECIISQEKS